MLSSPNVLSALRWRWDFCAFLRHNHDKPSILFCPADGRFPTDDLAGWRSWWCLVYWRQRKARHWRITATRWERDARWPPYWERGHARWRGAAGRCHRPASDLQSGKAEKAIDDAFLNATLARVAAFGCFRCDSAFDDY